MKVRLVKYAIYIIIIITLFLFLISKCSHPGHKYTDTPASGDTLNIAIEFSPTGMYLDGDTLCGLNYEIVSAIFKNNGWPIKIVPIASLSEATDKLADGTYDILIPDAAAIAELKKDFIFTEPIYLDKQVLVSLREPTDKEFSVGNLAGDTVWVPYNSPFAERLSNLSREIGDTIYIMEEPTIGSEGLLIMVSTGEIKQAVVNRYLVRKMIGNGYSQLKIEGEISFNQFQSWMLTDKNKALRDSINRYITAFKKTDDYRRILKKYM